MPQCGFLKPFLSNIWRPFWISRWPPLKMHFELHHWIPHTRKHRFRHQDHVSMLIITHFIWPDTYFGGHFGNMQISQFPRSVGLVVRQICITGVPMKGKPLRKNLYQPTQGMAKNPYLATRLITFQHSNIWKMDSEHPNPLEIWCCTLLSRNTAVYYLSDILSKLILNALKITFFHLISNKDGKPS